MNLSNRPLLVIGGKGGGKTTLAQSTASRLEKDRSVLASESHAAHAEHLFFCFLTAAEAVYIEVARLDGDVRVNQVKDEMTAWIQDNQGEGRTCLVLDDLDLLIGPDNEVCFT